MKDNLDQEHLAKAVRSATEEVFSTMLGMEICAGESYIERNTPGPSDGVAALVGLAGTWTGTGSISCSAAFACKLCSQFLMTEVEAVDEGVLDAVAELANMIIGNVKNIMEEDLGPMMLSIPTVVFGHNFTTRSLGRNEWTVIPFHSGGQRFDVQICLVRAQDKPAPIRHGFSQLHPVLE